MMPPLQVFKPAPLHVFQRANAILISVRRANFGVMFGAGIEIMIDVIDARRFQLRALIFV